jgi:hypothetical protein
MLKFESIVCYLNFLGIKTKIRKKVHIYVGYIFNFLSSIWTFFLLSCWVILSLSTNWLWSVSVTSNTLWCRQCDVKHIMMSSNTLCCRQCDVTHYDVVSVTSNTLWCRQCDVKHIMMSSVWRQTHYDVVSVTSNTLWCHQCDVKHIMMSSVWRQTHYDVTNKNSNVSSDCFNIHHH